jgi:hypothetical protein
MNRQDAKFAKKRGRPTTDYTDATDKKRMFSGGSQNLLPALSDPARFCETPLNECFPPRDPRLVFLASLASWRFNLCGLLRSGVR